MNRIKEEYRQLKKLYKETNDDAYLMRQCCIDHFYEVSIENYLYVVDFCLANNISGIIDIGCAMGYQSELFLEKNLNYVGVDCNDDFFWNEEYYIYLHKVYPCDLSEYKDFLAVSILCISWNCYLYEGDKTLNEQLEQLAKDFNKALLYIPENSIQHLKKYYKNVEHKRGNFYYLENSYFKE